MNVSEHTENPRPEKGTRVISNQIKAKYKKRADILALDQGGSGVIIELKRSMGTLGVDTQHYEHQLRIRG